MAASSILFAWFDPHFDLGPSWSAMTEEQRILYEREERLTDRASLSAGLDRRINR